MKFNILSGATIIALFTLTISINGQIKPERQWPGFRGYRSSGVLDNANLPESFDFNKMINVRWKTEIPGLGLSSPVIWGDKLFITTAISKSDNQGIRTGIYGDGMPVADSSVHDWKVFCIDKIPEKLSGKERHTPGYPKSGVIPNRLMPILPLPQMANMLLHFSDLKVYIVMIIKESLSGKKVLAFLNQLHTIILQPNGSLRVRQ
jgi:hypothetical protein